MKGNSLGGLTLFNQGHTKIHKVFQGFPVPNPK